MDVKLPNAHISNAVLAPYQRSFHILQHTIPSPPPVSPDDIIDCVEIEMVKPSPANMHITNYKSLNNYPIEEKGTFVDIRI